MSTNKSGFLDVGDGHQVYWEDWGNPSAPPIFHLHGGPGSGFTDKSKDLYEVDKNRVILHDQRGAGKSTPFASIEHNTTQDLVADMEKIRIHLGIEKMHVFGGSWGSTLALAYAIAHPDRVYSLVLRGVFLGTKFETDWINEGYPRYFFPDAWQRFIALVPEGERATGDSIMHFYAEQINSADAEVSRHYANEWTLWEATLTTINLNPEEIEKEVFEDRSTTSMAKIEAHYFSNKCFMPENFIIDSIERIRHIPCEVVQGRFDMCTPPIGAYSLARAYGENLRLQWVNSGHKASEPETFSALRHIVQDKLIQTDIG
jgi:proline iminopeptidase